MDDSDDDSFDLEMNKSTFKRGRVGRNSVQAKKARREQALKSVLNSALKSGEQKLVQETRMVDIQKRNSEVRSPVALDEVRRASKIDSGGNGDNDIAKDLFASNADTDHNEPIDIKATACLGSRNTLNLYQLLNATDDEGKPNPVTKCSWSNINDAVEAFKGAVQWEQQQIQQQEKKQATSSQQFDAFCDEMLEQASDTRNFTFCLREMWLCSQNTDCIQRLPQSLLHWLFAMACAPVTVKIGKNETADLNNIPVDASLLSAKRGAYKTLCGLWSQKNGYPSQHKYLLHLKALPDQLREWCGSTFMVEKEEEKGENDGGHETNKPQEDIICVSSPSDLVRFLHLWALAFENGLLAIDDIQKDAVKDIANAILALMWAALDPVFASRHSSQNDGHEYIQTIVSCLMDTMRKITSDDADYKTWVDGLATQVFDRWSTQLGPGAKGTDAKDDKLAWLSLARTVQSLGGSQGYSQSRDLQFALARCVILRAMNDSSGQSDNDWISQSVAKSFQQWNLPTASRESQSWRVLGVAVAALSKLGASFPGDDPTKCYSVVQCAMVCIRLAMHGMSSEIDMSRKLVKGDSPTTKATDDDEPTEKKALCAAMIDLERSADRVSGFSRSRIMQNKFFPLASSALECTKSYARLLKLRLSPSNGGEVKQRTVDSFFKPKSTSGSQ